jgi:hypothetical protein
LAEGETLLFLDASEAAGGERRLEERSSGRRDGDVGAGRLRGERVEREDAVAVHPTLHRGEGSLGALFEQLARTTRLDRAGARQRVFGQRGDEVLRGQRDVGSVGVSTRERGGFVDLADTHVANAFARDMVPTVGIGDEDGGSVRGVGVAEEKTAHSAMMAAGAQ